MKKKNILHITPLFPPDYAGGSKQASLLIDTILKKTDTVQIEVLTGTHNKKLGGTSYINGVKVKRIYYKKNNIFFIFLYFIKFFFFIIFNAKKNDIIHIHGGKLYFLVIGMIKPFYPHLKTIFKMTLVGSDDPSSIKNRILGNLQLYFFKKHDIIIGISKELLKIYNKVGLDKDKLRYIPNGVIIPQETRKRNTDDFNIGFVGILNKRKGVDTILSLRDIYFKKINYNFILVGPFDSKDNDIRIEIASQIQNNKLYAGKLERVGNVTQVDKYYNMFDILLFLSHREGLPNVMLEALSKGIPIVASNKPWAHDIITDKINGFLVENENKKEIFDRIYNLYKDKNLYKKISREAKETAKNNFNINIIAKKYIELYEKI